MTKAKNAAAQSAATYTVREPLRHDGIDYQPGDPIELREGQAAILIEQMVLESPLPAIDPDLPT